MKNKKLILVTGPTAVGKTAKAIALAKEQQTCVISADSRQVYRELNIGVARPSEAELSEVKHHLIAHVSIQDDYNAGAYAREARTLINRLFKSSDTLVVCGGTGLYLRALLKGFDPLPEKNDALRLELQTELENNGLSALQNRLLNADPERYYKTDLNNPQRLIRAIEVALAEPVAHSDIPAFEHAFDLQSINMEMPRTELYARINQRVDAMAVAGLEAEARALYPLRHLNALQTVGYSEWWPYFEGQTDRASVIEKIKQHTRNYAKRQLTWFKNQL